MVNPSYESIIADIVKFSQHGDEPAVQKMVSDFCLVYTEFLVEYTRRTNGYMTMAAFVVTFTEMKKVLAEAKGQDKVLISGLMQAVIGSFGSTIQ